MMYCIWQTMCARYYLLKCHGCFIIVGCCEMCFSQRGLECRLIHRYDFHKSLINWADIIFTAGGDGTFLMVASNIHDCSKPVVGINTDPLR